MKVKSESEVAQSCPTLSGPMDRSLPGSFIHGIFQARVLEWGAIAFSGREEERLAKKETNKPRIRVLTSAGSFARLGFINQGSEKETIWLPWLQEECENAWGYQYVPWCIPPLVREVRYSSLLTVSWVSLTQFPKFGLRCFTASTNALKSILTPGVGWRGRLEAKLLFPASNRMVTRGQHDSPLPFTKFREVILAFLLLFYPLRQWSTTFLAPGTDFVKDSFSMDWYWVEEGIVSGWLKHIVCIVHFISIIITSAPPQITEH